MEKLQARIRAIQAVQTNMSSVKRMNAELGSTGDVERQAESNVVEMPRVVPVKELADDVTAQRTPSKQKSSSTKRKSQASPAKQKTTARARQWRNVNQQPYIEELNQLEVQAKKLNQLADAGVENLDAQVDTIIRRIDQVLARLEATMPQAGAIADTSAQNATGHTLKQAVQDASETAQALRYLSNRGCGSQVAHNFATPRPGFGAPNPSMDHWRQPRFPRAIAPLRRLEAQFKPLFRLPKKPMDRLGDAALWIAIAALARVSVRFLLAINPNLAPVLILLMLVPAGLAIFLAAFVPKAGFVPVYRLFLVMVGFLLGGRF